MSLKGLGEDFPGGTMDKNLPASVGDMDLIPDPDRFHMLQSNWVHVLQLLSLYATNTEACVR